jgi:ribosome-binding factor A
MPTPLRLQRIAGRISQELSVILMQEINDPRLAGVLITDVTVDRELAYADIYVSALEGKERSTEAIQGLEHAAPFLRRTLADRIELRVFPRLRFHWDPTPERADHIEKLLASLREETTNSSKDKPANG